MSFIHLNISRDESITMSLIRGQIMYHRVIDPCFNECILLFLTKKHVIIMINFILTDLHVVIYTSVVLRGKVIWLVVVLNRLVAEVFVIKVWILHNQEELELSCNSEYLIFLGAFLGFVILSIQKFLITLTSSNLNEFSTLSGIAALNLIIKILRTKVWVTDSEIVVGVISNS